MGPQGVLAGASCVRAGTYTAEREVRADMAHADPGLFGPESVTWQLHGDPMMWVGGVRALYLQALHPRAVRGVMQNSDFRKDAWGG